MATASPHAVARTQGTWTMRRADEAEADPDTMVHVALRTPGLNTFYAPVSDFQGLDMAQLEGKHGAHFALRRDAGTLVFDGDFGHGHGGGSFRFSPDPAFAAALRQRGMRAPNAREQFALARHDGSLAFLDLLAANGYARPSTESFVQASVSPVDIDYLREMSKLGYRFGTLDALVRLANNGVEPKDIERAMEERPGDRPQVEELLRLAANPEDALLDPGAKAELEDAVDDAVDEAQDDAEPAAAGDADTPTSGHWRIYDRRGDSAMLELAWDDDTQWRRQVALSELSTLDGEHFRIANEAGTFEFEGKLKHGTGKGEFVFAVNRAFPGMLKSIGVRGTEGASDHQLKNLAYGGTSLDSVRELRELGFKDLSLRDLVDLAVFNIRPDFIRAMREKGARDTNTVRGITDLRLNSSIDGDGN
jgi:hypothetical protein